MPIVVPMGKGNPNSRIMLVGEAWGENEEKFHEPFVGASGLELNRMLQEAGIMRAECYATNVVNARPPQNKIEAWIPQRKTDITPDCVDVMGKRVRPIVAAGVENLRRECQLVRPSVIIALGGTALWALTGNESIVKWRGSLLRPEGMVASDSSLLPTVVPTYHPAAVLRMWDWRKIAVLDFKRAKRQLVDPVSEPPWQFEIRPSFDAVVKRLSWLWEWVQREPVWIDLDLETAAGHIKCCGLSWSKLEGICIPLMSDSDRSGYWLAEEEGVIVWWLRRILIHPNCWTRGQNLLYDCQYTWRHWKFIPNVKQDTMISHHVLWAGMPKSLAFQASMYCDYYVNWKPDKEQWKEGG